MKICYLSAEYPPALHGGAGTFTQVTARALVRAGHEVRVAGVCDHHHQAPDHEDDHGVSVWRLRAPRYRGGGVAGRIELYRLVKRWVQQGDVEVVDAPDHEGPFAGWPRLGAPLVLRAQGSYSYFLHELGQPIPMKMFQFERFSYRRADAWSATSEYIGEATKRLFHLREGPNAVLYNSVEEPAATVPFENRSTDEVVFTGTLTAKKGVISLIEAWPAIRAHVPRAQLHIFGKDGVAPTGTSMKAYLQGKLPQSSASSVHFYDHVSRSKLAAALSTARVAVFPSYAEGFALAPLEAMVAGCPTIYSRCGSGPELIVHERDGLLIDPQNATDIAEAVVRVLEDDALAHRLGTNGRERVLSTFTSQKVLPANELFYQNVIRSFQ